MSVMQAYKVGDSDERPWGRYVVTAVGDNGTGEEFCEKEIVVRPGQVLSLQSHDHRRETWRVTQGVLTVVLDGRRLTLKEGEEIKIPLGGIHCMANLHETDCVVFERQEGLCREEDIHRFADAYGRAGEKAPGETGEKALSLYQQLLKEIGA